MSPINVVDVLAAVVLSLTGTGLLGNYLLQRYQVDHETKITRLKTELDGEVRELQTSLDRTVFVHRTQFDTEFAALRDIWTNVAGVRASMGLVRPLMDIVPADETPEQKEAREFERFRAFTAHYGALVHAVDSQSPFVPRDIYRKLEEAIQIAGREKTEVEIERPERQRDPIRDWHARGREHFQQFCAVATEVSDLIRTRLETLTIVPENR